MNEKIKVIIGDESKEFGCMLANSLRGRGFFAVTRDNDGLLLLEAIRSEEPDVVIVDSIIPGIDAAELIKRCDSFVHKPFFIVTSAYRNVFAERQIMSMENAYFMLKPFDRFAPQRVIVVAVHKRNAEFAAVLLAFVFASQILLCRENVWVEVKNRRCVSVLRQPFKNGA